MARFLTIYGLSRQLGLTVESVRRLLADGTIPPPRAGGYGPRFFSEAQAQEIRRILMRHRITRRTAARGG